MQKQLEARETHLYLHDIRTKIKSTGLQNQTTGILVMICKLKLCNLFISVLQLEHAINQTYLMGLF